MKTGGSLKYKYKHKHKHKYKHKNKDQNNLEGKVAGVGDRGESPVQGPRKLLSPKVKKQPNIWTKNIGRIKAICVTNEAFQVQN